MAITELSKTKVLVTLAAGLAIAGCGSSGSSSSSGGGASGGASNAAAAGAGANVNASEAQSAATGDIPDNQTFLRYRNNKAGYSIVYPEGWARRGSADDVSFSDKDNQVRVAIGSGPAPTVASARSALLKQVGPSAHLKLSSVKTETIRGSPAIHVVYNEQGPPDPVTGKRLTVMVDRYVLAKGGKVATVDESTPVGVDNVDAYRMIIQSFKWA